MTEPSTPTIVRLERVAPGAYVAANARGVRLAIGGTDAFSPVELLLAAIAGCSSVDVDLMTSRRAEPERFAVTASAVKVREGGNHLEDVEVTFSLRFPAGAEGDAARTRIAPAVRASQERDCTVSRTVELGTPITFAID